MVRILVAGVAMLASVMLVDSASAGRFFSRGGFGGST